MPTKSLKHNYIIIFKEQEDFADKHTLMLILIKESGNNLKYLS